MTWSEVVSNVRDEIRRRLDRAAGARIPVLRSDAVEQLDAAPLAEPAVDVYENERQFLIVADVPGGTREGTRVAWAEGHGVTLQVKSAPSPGGTLWADEREGCDWFRTLELPAYADGSRASATLRDGVLTVRVPKRLTNPVLVPVRLRDGSWRSLG
jgi:HSP20 family molecular chaperone IbpA